MLLPRRPLLPIRTPTLHPLRFLRLYETARDRPIPSPTPFVPDHTTFLTLIGRNLSAQSSKIPSWAALFSYSAAELRGAGIEPARARRYLLRMRERFRQGDFGIGGDLRHVRDGVGEVRVFEVPLPEGQAGGLAARATANRSSAARKVVLNVPPGETALDEGELSEAVPVRHVKIKGTGSIAGRWVQMIEGTKGLAARIAVREGLWEEKRGRKVDGGERRKAEVRAKRRAQEKKEAAPS